MALLFTSLASVFTIVIRIRIAWRQVWRVLLIVFFYGFPTHCLLFNQFTGIAILRLIKKFDDEYDNDGSGSGSPGTCNFPFCSDESVGSVGKSAGGVSGVGSGVFVLNGIEWIGDVVTLFVFIPRGVESKGSRLLKLSWRPKSWFSLLASKSVLAL